MKLALARIKPEPPERRRRLEGFLALANAAEQEHRVRRLEAHRGDGAPLYPGKTDSCAGTLDYLLDEEHVDMTKIEAALASQQLESVLTAPRSM